MTTTIHEPVTGHHGIVNAGEPLAALSEFYRALNTRDIALMEQNWDASDDAIMDNPLGGIKCGWAEIRDVYEHLFASSGEYKFEFSDYMLQQHGEVFIAIGRERGHMVSSTGQVLKLAIRTTRIFRRVESRWRQIHHHGSIDNSEMLARYQQAVDKRAA